MSKKKKCILVGGAVAVPACIYLGISIFFLSHFFYGTSINGKDFSMKSLAEAESYFEETVEQYALTIVPREGSNEYISGKDISLTLRKNKELEKLLARQSAFLWPEMFLNRKDAEISIPIEYDEGTLAAQIQALDCFTNAGKTDPQNARPEFDGEKYIAGDEVPGTKVDQELLKEVITDAVEAFCMEVNLEEKDCYQKPKYTSESEELKEACDKLNQYCKASITYDMAPYQEVIDASVISEWLNCDAEMQVTFDENKAREYMNQFAARYKTAGGTRPLTTPIGKETEVSGGTYGWVFDEAAEAEALIASIKAGDVVTKEPAYTQRGASHEPQDWGKTFIEVDISAQHMWYIADGSVVFESDVVTGKPYAHSTPSGVYDVLNMQRGATLVGNIVPETGEPEYRTYVDFWMPVTKGGVGFHDATWQPYFGGDLYLYNGSHGCINMPWNGAETLFDLISVGTPVVMHY